MNYMALKKGFTLVELLAVIAIITILAGIALANLLPARDKAKISKTEVDIASIQVNMRTYLERSGNVTYPPNTDACSHCRYRDGDIAAAKTTWRAVVDSIPDIDSNAYYTDAWGNEYAYDNNLQGGSVVVHNKPFELYTQLCSLGPNGQYETTLLYCRDSSDCTPDPGLVSNQPPAAQGDDICLFF